MKFPEVNELVIGKVKKIFPYGAFLHLEEYDMEAFMHISEVASRWIRNIRNFLREGQRVVVKVIRVDRAKGHVDVSLRRVSQREAREKLLQVKRKKRAENLFSLVVERMGKENAEEIKEKLEKEFGELYYAFEDAVKEGVEIFKGVIPESWAKVICEVANKYMEVPKVRIKGVLYLQSTHPKGIDVIRDVLLKIAGLECEKGVSFNLSYLGAPRYQIEVEAYDYKTAEKYMKKAVELAKQNEGPDLIVDFERVKK